MSNTSKSKGTQAETAVTRYLQANGFPYAERRALRGNNDAGDILAAPGLVIEVKAHATAATGQPGPALLTKWMGEAELERRNAGADLCPLVVKRKGTTDPGQWFAYLTLRDLSLLTTNTYPPHPDTVVQLAFGHLVTLLRAGGYGDPETTR